MRTKTKGNKKVTTGLVVKKAIYSVYRMVFTKVMQYVGKDTYTSYKVDLKLIAQFDKKDEVLDYLHIKDFNGMNHGFTISKSDLMTSRKTGCPLLTIKKAVHTSKGFTVLVDEMNIKQGDEKSIGEVIDNE